MVWHYLGLNPGLPDYLRTLYPLGQWASYLQLEELPIDNYFTKRNYFLKISFYLFVSFLKFGNLDFEQSFTSCSNKDFCILLFVVWDRLSPWVIKKKVFVKIFPQFQLSRFGHLHNIDKFFPIIVFISLQSQTLFGLNFIMYISISNFINFKFSFIVWIM